MESSRPPYGQLGYNKHTVPITTTPPSVSPHRQLHCTVMGTGAILLADVLPSLIVKLLGPTIIQKIHFHVKVVLVVILAMASFILVALSSSMPLSIFGVICASLSAGIGEITFLSMSAYFHKDVVSTWSSGTGGAGVFGALSYLLLTFITTPKITLFIILCVPGIILIIYWFVLVKPPQFGSIEQEVIIQEQQRTPLLHESPNHDCTLSEEHDVIVRQENPIFQVKLQLLYKLLPLMIPLCLVYFFEYLINQSLFELMVYQKEFIGASAQYRAYQLVYQFGVFLSRSSVNLFKFRHIWILALLQTVNFGLLICHVIWPFIPSIWILFAIILYEGLLGGLAYVNTFYRITLESETRYKEFNMATASMGDSLGITLSGVLAVPLHKYLCYKLA